SDYSLCNCLRIARGRVPEKTAPTHLDPSLIEHPAVRTAQLEDMPSWPGVPLAPNQRGAVQKPLYAGLLACCRAHGPHSHALPTRRDVRIERHDSTVYRLHNAQRAYRTLPAQAGACGPSIRMFRAGAMAHAGGENGLCRVAQEILIASGLELAVE